MRKSELMEQRVINCEGDQNNCFNNNNNNIYLKSNIQCTYRYEFSGLYNNNIQLQ